MYAITSSIFAEIYLQYIANTKIFEILLKFQVTGYFLYVNILIIYNRDKTNRYGFLNIFSNIMHTRKFTMKEEKQNKINFLHITIRKEEYKTSTDIYRKQATADTVNTNDSSHPQEYKLAAITCLANRMETYNFSGTNKEKENNTIKQMLYNNKYDTPLLNKLTMIENTTQTNTPKNKWAKITYVGKERKFNTKIFKILRPKLLSQHKTL